MWVMTYLPTDKTVLLAIDRLPTYLWEEPAGRSLNNESLEWWSLSYILSQANEPLIIPIESGKVV